MKFLKENPLWTVSEQGFDKDKVIHNGTQFMIANGYMGYRGTLPCFKKDKLPATVLAGVYDQADKDSWREPVNAPNSLFMEVSVDGDVLDMEAGVTSHSQALDVLHSTFQRETTFQARNNSVTLYSERFLSADDVHLIAEKNIIQAEKECQLVIKTGLDLDIWDQNGPHFKTKTTDTVDQRILFSGVTNEKDRVEICQLISGLGEPVSFENGLGEYHITLKAGEELTFFKFAHIYTTKDSDIPEELALLDGKKEHGYDQLLEQHKNVWAERWNRYDVTISGDDRGLLALRYSIYLLLSVAPTHTDKVAIPARGLSAQVYKGAMFWDTEMHMSPMFNLTDPQIARNLLAYRYNTLQGARNKAKRFNFDGAFFPWEAQESGEEMCTFFNITSMFTGRKMRTYFIDKQLHVNCAIINACWDYVNASGDKEFLLKECAEIALESARFFYSYSYFKHNKGRFEILDVVGPDEYHERVHNNFYTNRMIKDSMEKTLRILQMLKDEQCFDAFANQLGLDDKELANLQFFTEKLFVPQPNENHVIEQHDGYFELEDASLEEVRSRLIDPNEHWGGAEGIATETQILKQADVVLALYLLRDQYSTEVKKASWEYYEPRTAHNSSLSPCVYALLACDIGKAEWAYDYFLKTAEIDLIPGATTPFLNGMFKGGTHPAANGGAYMTAVNGFAGLQVREDCLELKPQLPEKWTSMDFKVSYQGELLRIRVEGGHTRVGKVNTSNSHLNIRIKGQDFVLADKEIEA